MSHHFSHQHDHHHGHTHLSSEVKGFKLLWVVLLNLSITLVQLIGGVVSNSLSLVSDALHNLGDSSAIFIAFAAGKISKRKANERFTFGYKRVEILAALFNAVVLIAICLFLLVEAYKRFIHPEPIQGKLMLLIAVFGLLANLISVLLLNKDKEKNLNVKAAYMHLLGDTLSSVAVIAGGLAIWLFNIYWIDPLVTVLVGIYIIYHTWGIVKQTVDILLQTTPENIDLPQIRKDIESIEGIDNIHHLHVWSLDDESVHLEAHLNLENNMPMLEFMALREKAEILLENKFGIQHITLQAGYNCCNGVRDLIVTNENNNKVLWQN